MSALPVCSTLAAAPPLPSSPYPKLNPLLFSSISSKPPMDFVIPDLDPPRSALACAFPEFFRRFETPQLLNADSSAIIGLLLRFSIPRDHRRFILRYLLPRMVNSNQLASIPARKEAPLSRSGTCMFRFSGFKPPDKVGEGFQNSFGWSFGVPAISCLFRLKDIGGRCLGGWTVVSGDDSAAGPGEWAAAQWWLLVWWAELNGARVGWAEFFLIHRGLGLWGGPKMGDWTRTYKDGLARIRWMSVYPSRGLVAAVSGLPIERGGWSKLRAARSRLGAPRVFLGNMGHAHYETRLWVGPNWFSSITLSSSGPNLLGRTESVMVLFSGMIHLGPDLIGCWRECLGCRVPQCQT